MKQTLNMRQQPPINSRYCDSARRATQNTVCCSRAADCPPLEYEHESRCKVFLLQTLSEMPCVKMYLRTSLTVKNVRGSVGPRPPSHDQIWPSEKSLDTLGVEELGTSLRYFLLCYVWCTLLPVTESSRAVVTRCHDV